jgi:hypothetical protein
MELPDLIPQGEYCARRGSLGSHQNHGTQRHCRTRPVPTTPGVANLDAANVTSCRGIPADRRDHPGALQVVTLTPHD